MSDHSLESYLSQQIYFSELPVEIIDLLVQTAITRSYLSDETIFHEGVPASGLWLIQKGRVKISKISSDGTEHILHILGVGDTFNDIAALDGGLNPANAIALSQSTVSMIPSEEITYLIETNGAFALKVVRILSQRVRGLVGQIEDLALYSVIVRLSRFLLKQLNDPGLSGPGVTRTAIAAHLATTPQTISVALRELEEAEAIEFDRHHILITDEEKLQAIAMV